MSSESEGDARLDADERARLEALRSAGSLADLVGVTGADSEHGAYFDAKREWYDLRDRALPSPAPGDGLPGDRVEMDGRAFHVHGITHADTRPEREFLRGHVSDLVDDGATVYCEQGIRPMYFSDYPDVCEMDDYLWARERCEELDLDAQTSVFSRPQFDGLEESLQSLAAQFRETVFSLIESQGDRYGEEFKQAAGDVASGFLMSHEDLSTGDDFEAFTRTRQAATDPDALGALQRYYEKTFLPQPLEREWLCRHDPELEVVTHARNERMADYVVYHTADAEAVHVIVGAAHQPGVVYYLQAHRDGDRRLAGFEPVG